MRLFLALIFVTLLTGCGVVARKKADELLSRSTQQDWGVLDSNHESIERAYILQTLKDPDSARIRFTKPIRDVSHDLGEPVLAWYSWVYVNAKNSFGGYVGERPYAFSYQCPVNKNCRLINYAIPNDEDFDKVKWQN